MQTRFRHQNKPIYIGIGRNKYSKSIATKLVYQRKPIDTAISEKFVCYNHKTKCTDWCPIPIDGGLGICLRERGRVKDFDLKQKYNITYILHFFCMYWLNF